MQESRKNFTEEVLTWDRADVMQWLDESRPKGKDGKPDKSKPHKRTPANAKAWGKGKGMSDVEAEKFASDLPSYE